MEKVTHPDKIRCDPRRQLFFVTELLMRRRRGVDDKGLRITDICKIASQFQSVYCSAYDIGVALDTEAEDTSKRIRTKKLLRPLVIFVCLQA